MAALQLDALWHSAFGEGSTRPVPYSSEELNEEGWQPLTDPQNFILKLPALNHQQLYAASSNNQNAMKLAQDEYLEIEQQIANIKGRETIKNPQTLPDPDVFEERKESALYGYKYDGNRPALLHAGIPGIRSADELTESEKHDVRLFQEPFEQGGFVPKEREYKAMAAKAKNPNNIDGWQPIVTQDGRRRIPKQQTHHDEYNITYVKRIVDQNGETVRPVSPTGNEGLAETPDKLVNKRLTRTRFDGKKFPPTRDASEEASGGSTPRGRKRASSSGDESREHTPSFKRQKVLPAVNGQQPRPKHPNQYTKARDRAQEGTLTTTGTPAPQAATKAVSSSKVPWRDLSPDAKYTHTWTNAELHEAVREDHSWLHPDPAQAASWKQKLLDNQNPIRSFAMFKKWRYWKLHNLDKRPRNKNTGNENGASNKENEAYTPSQKPRRTAAKARKVGDSAASTPAITPATTPAPAPASGTLEINGDSERVSTPVAKPRVAKLTRGKEQGSESSHQKVVQQEKEQRTSRVNIRRVSTDSETPSTVDEESPVRQTGRETIGSGRELRRPSLKHQDSESTIVVTSGNTMAANSSGTPMRRSLRNRRGSA